MATGALLQIHNREIQRLYRTDLLDRAVFMKACLAISRYALLLTRGPLIIWPKALLECDYFGTFLWHIRPLMSAGLLHYASASPDINDMLAEKRSQYRDQSALFPLYFASEELKPHLRWTQKMLWRPRGASSSSTRAIRKAWNEELDAGRLARIVMERTSRKERSNFERALARAPDRLDGRAFVTDNATGAIEIDVSLAERHQIGLTINQAYLGAYLADLDASMLVDTPLGPMDCGLLERGESLDRLISMRQARECFDLLGLRDWIERRMKWSESVQIVGDPDFVSLSDRVAMAARSSSVDPVPSLARAISSSEHAQYFQAARAVPPASAKEFGEIVRRANEAVLQSPDAWGEHGSSIEHWDAADVGVARTSGERLVLNYQPNAQIGIQQLGDGASASGNITSFSEQIESWLQEVERAAPAMPELERESVMTAVEHVRRLPGGDTEGDNRRLRSGIESVRRALTAVSVATAGSVGAEGLISGAEALLAII